MNRRADLHVAAEQNLVNLPCIFTPSFSRLTGLGIHTLRYYELEGLLRPQRTTGNRRVYSEKDLAWVEFIKRLKATGMPLQEIQRFAALRSEGDSTLGERTEMLIRHRRTLDEQIAKLQEHKRILDGKIDFYLEERARLSPAAAPGTETDQFPG